MLRLNHNNVYSNGQSVILAKLSFRCCLDAGSVLEKTTNNSNNKQTIKQTKRTHTHTRTRTHTHTHAPKKKKKKKKKIVADEVYK